MALKLGRPTFGPLVCVCGHSNTTHERDGGACLYRVTRREMEDDDDVYLRGTDIRFNDERGAYCPCDRFVGFPRSVISTYREAAW